MKDKKAIALIESYLEGAELEKIDKVCISFKKKHYPLIARLFQRNTSIYFLKIVYRDQSQRFIRVVSSQKEAVKQSIKPFNSNVNLYRTAV